MSARGAATVIAIAVGAMGAGAACAQAQDSRSAPATVVTKTLVKSAAQKECFSLVQAQVLYYRFRSDTPLDFKLSHQDEKEIVDVKLDRVANGAGSYTAKKSADYCLVWTNAGDKAATLHYEFQRGS
jgi:hypothetical protein